MGATTDDKNEDAKSKLLEHYNASMELASKEKALKAELTNIAKDLKAEKSVLKVYKDKYRRMNGNTLGSLKGTKYAPKTFEVTYKPTVGEEVVINWGGNKEPSTNANQPANTPPQPDVTTPPAGTDTDKKTDKKS